MSELYHLASDPGEDRNLINNPAHAKKLKELQSQLAQLLKKAGADPDKMPLDEGIKAELPDQSIR